MVLDNLGTHRNTGAAKALREHGFWFFYLPPYGPDLNPIETALSKPKAQLRSISARFFKDVFEAITEVCDLFEPQECSNYISAEGYESS